MKILVIGGAGYIGSHIVKKLCDEKNTATVYDNLSTGFKLNVDKRAKFVKGDILDFPKLSKTMKGYDAVMHFAGLKNAGTSMIDVENYAKINISGTINILNAMTKNNIKYIVFSSSAAVYGNPKYIPMDEKHPLVPENFYGFTKLEIEKTLEWYSKLKGIKYAALRYFNAAGYSKDSRCLEQNPGNLFPIIMEFITGMRKELQVYGNDYPTKDGTGVRDYIHVLDLADAHSIALDYIKKNDTNLTVNLATGKGYGVIEIIKATEKLTGKKINYKIVSRRFGDPSTVIADPKLAKKILKWSAKHSDINNIIISMYDAYNRINSVKKDKRK
jgi:UDP-glucose 4-epimerase